MLFDSFFKLGFLSVHKRTRKTKKQLQSRKRLLRLRFERLEDRALLSATTSDSLGLSWVTPLAGQAFTMNAEINGTLIAGTSRTGTITLSDNGSLLASVNLATATPTGTVGVGWYALSVPGGLPLGSNLLNVAYSGDANYTPSSSTTTLNVNNDSLGLSYSTSVLAGLPYTVNATINGALVNGTPRTGTLSLLEGSNVLATVNVATATPTSSGAYALAVPGGLAAGTHNFQVTYTGDTNYSALTSNLANVTAADDLVTASYPSTALVGQPYSMSAAIQGVLVNNTPRTGTLSLVNVETSTTLASIDISTATPSSTGYYTLTAPAGLSPGTNGLKVVYSGDANYPTASALVIAAGVSALATNIAPSYPTSLSMDQSFTVNAAIDGNLSPNLPRTGTLSLMDGSTTLASVNVALPTPNGSVFYPLTVPGGLAAGAYNLTVSYSGDGNYAASTATLLPITVHAVSTSIGWTYANPLLVNQPFTLSALVNGTLLADTPRTGTLTLSDNGTTLASVNLATATPNSAGYYALSVPAGLPGGSSVLTVAYSGDANYAPSTSTIPVTVNNDSLSLGYSTSVLTGASYSVSVAINGALVNGAARTGTLSLVEGTTTLASVNVGTTAAASGYYQYTLTVPGGLAAGANNLKVVYSGDANYSALSANLATINSANDLLALSFSSQALAGQAFSLGAAIQAGPGSTTPPTGTLSLVEGSNTLATVNVATATPNSAGFYTLTVPGGLTTGANILQVVYSGDANFAAASTTVVVTGTSMLSTSLGLGYTTSLNLGQSFSVNANINGTLEAGLPRTGTLSLLEGGTVLASINLATTTPLATTTLVNNADYALTLPTGLPLGTYNNLSVAYSGDSNYAPSTAALLAVTVHSPTTSIGWSYSNPLANQPFTFNAEINGTLLANTPRTGTLTLSDNGTTVASVNLATATPSSIGYYALSVPAGLPGGTNVLIVSYSGDSNYGASTSTTTLTVNNDSLSMNYSTSVLTGVNYTVNVAILGTLTNSTPRTGTLSLVEGSTTLASVNVATAMPSSTGYYALTVPGGLAAGANVLKVVYSGDANYSALSYNLATVNASNDLLSLSYASQALTGQPYSMSAALQTSAGIGTAPTGTLSLVEGTNTLATVNIATATPNSSGSYTLTVPGGLASGVNSLKVVYSGDSNYAAATSSITVTGVSTVSTNIGLSWSTPLAGLAFTMNAVINPTATAGVPHTGTLTLSDNGSILTSVNLATATPNSSGYFALSVPAGLPAGSNVLTVAYSGDSNYAASTAVTTLMINDDSLSLNYTTSVLSGVNYTVNVAINGTLVNNTPRTGTLSLVEGSTTLATVNVATATPSSSGFYALTVAGGLPAGANVMKVVYSGDANYAALSYNLATVNVASDLLLLSYTSQALVGQPYSLSAAIQTNSADTTPPTGTLSLVQGSTTLASVNIATATPSSSGYYTLTVPGGLAVGANSLQVVYSGDSNYATASSSLTVTGVSTLATNIGLGWINSLAGQAFTMYATVNPTALAGVPHTGTLTLSENGTPLATVNLATSTPNSAGEYTLSVPAGLPAGSNVLVVAYSGDSNYAASTSTATLTISNDSLSLSYSTSVLTGVNYTVNVGINGTLVNNTPRTGTLSLVEGSTTLASVNVATATPNSSGQYALTVPGGLAAGANVMKVVYSGDGNYSALSGNLATVNSASDLVLLSYTSQALVGQPYSLGAALSTNPAITTPPTGTVSLVEGSTTLASVNIATATPSSSGYYTLTVPGGLSLGANSLQVVYSGDSNYATASSSLTVTGVSTLSTSINLSWLTPLAGQAFTMSADINPTALAGVPHTGTLTLSDNGSVLTSINLATATPSSSGYYALSVPAGLPAGSNVLVVAYSGDSNYAASTGTTTLTINNDSLSLSYNTSVLTGVNYTVNVAINGTLVNNTPRTGTLSLVEGSTTLATVNVATATPNSSGQYALTVPGGLAAGANILKVLYSGDANYSALTYNLATVNAASDLVLLSYTSQALVGQPYSLTAAIQTNPAITTTPTGTLSLVQGSTTLASVNIATATPSSSGYYTLTVPGGLATGANSLQVVYSGDSNFASASTPLTVTGVSTLATNIGLGWTNSLAGQAFTMYATVNPTALAGVPHTGTLTLSENGTTLATVNLATSTPNSAGQYTLSVPAGLPAGSNAVTVSYSGDSNYAASTASATVTINNDALSLSFSSTALVGASYTVNAAITGTLVNGIVRTGTLTLVEGANTLATVNVANATPNSSGQYALTVPGGLAAGANSLKVVYSGDANYSTVSTTFSVTGSTTLPTTITLSYPTSLAGQAFTMSALINGTLDAGVARTGTLTLSMAGTTLASINLATTQPNSSGWYALSVPGGLPVGSDALTVAYSGDANYGASASTATLTINNDSLSLGYSTTVLTGANYTVTVGLSAALINSTPPTGTISLVEGSTTLASVNVASVTPTINGSTSTASYALTVPGGLAAGANSLKVVYSGDTNYSSLASSMATVTASNDLLSLSDSIGETLVGEPFTLNVAIETSPGSTAVPTGTLTLTNGTNTVATLNLATATPNSLGQYAMAVPGGLVAGSNVFKVAYSGDTNYSATSLTEVFTGVTSFSTSLSWSYSTPLANQPFTLSAAINGTLATGIARTGTLTLSDNGSSLVSINLATTQPNSSGWYTLSVPAGLPMGSNVLTIAYSGDTNYTASTTTTTVTVNDDSLSPSYSTTASVGQPYSLTVGINPVAGATAVPTGTLSLMQGTTVLATINLSQSTPNSSGKYTLTVPGGLAAGANSLKIVYSGDVNFSALTISLATITAS